MATIFLILVGTVLLVVVFLLFSPLQVWLRIGFHGWRFTGTGIFSFFHPRLIALHYDFGLKKSKLLIFGRSWGRKRAERKTVEEQPVQEDLETRKTSEPEIIKPASSGSMKESSSEPLQTMASTETTDSTPSPEPVAAEPELLHDAAEASGETDSVVVTPENVAPSAQHGIPPQHETEGEPDSFSSADENAESKDATKEETVAETVAEKDNWFKRLQRNRYFYFLKNGRWRGKVIRWLLRVIRSLFALVKFDHFQCSLHAGIKNPMVVGTLFGMYEAVRAGLQLQRPYVVVFTPVFMKNYCAGSLRFRTATSLFRVLFPVLVALFTFPVFHTAWLWWSFSRCEKRRKKLAVA